MTTQTARIEVFRPGRFTPMQGQEIVYSAGDLKAIADAYNAETAPAPVVVGHPTTDAPAYAWAKSFEYDAKAERLYATVGDINPDFAEAVRKGAYRKVSLSFHRPDGSANPVPGTWYPKHIGFLGGAAPAVAGLRNVAFSADDGAVTVSSDFGMRDESMGVLRMLREFLNEKLGREDADKVDMSQAIEWLSEKTMDKTPSFSANSGISSAERDELVKLRQNVVEQQVEKLVTSGKLLPAFKDEVLSFASSLDDSQSVSFSDGKSAKSRDWFFSYLERQPQVVTFGAFDMGKAPDDVAVPSRVPDGYSVDPRQNDLYNRARQLEREKGVSFSEAVDIASRGDT